MAENRDDQRSEEMQRLDRQVTGNSVNARTDQTRTELRDDAEALDRKYADGDNRDRQDRT